MFLEVSNLSVYYKLGKVSIPILSDFNFSADTGELISIVGESGSGKSTFGYALAGLLPPNGRMTGNISIEGKNVVNFREKEREKIRGTTVFMIFQNPLNSLNPVKNVGVQLFEALRIRRSREGILKDDLEQMKQQVMDVLKSLRFPDPENILRRYPHELSGGQVQRVIIAMALLLRPKLLIADEPTTALDVTIQAQVVDLLKQLNRTVGTSILFITHDIGLAYAVGNKILVFYAGRLMEEGDADQFVRNPLHPYTVGLLASIPTSPKSKGKLKNIQGSPPSFLNLPSGCKFWPRCPKVMPVCDKEEPKPINVGNSVVRCWLYG